MEVPSRSRFRSVGLLAFSAVLVLPVSQVLADGGVVYHNLAHNDAGLDYARTRSPEFATVQEFEIASLQEPLTTADLPILPQMTGGYPGVAVWDYDGDGDLDIYAANGPGSANSLFHSLLTETGSLEFVDVAVPAGVAAVDQDSAGVCYGDLDNDGDPDLVVLGRHAENRLFENSGDGTFDQVPMSGIEAGELWSTSCSLGDIDGDGLLDVFVANTADTTDSMWIFVEPFALNEHNQLFLNQGDLSFIDVSASSGVEDTAGLTAPFEGSPTVTWATTMVDVDSDGDLDIVHADDLSGAVSEAFGGVDSGLVHVFLNDGTGFFTDSPIDLNEQSAGAWMGVALGDLNCDGAFDLFVSNFGDYGLGSIGVALPLGTYTSRWFLGHGDGTFSDPGVGDLIATPFGWGAAIIDYDNDTDPDIVSHGGLDLSHAAIADNPGTIYQNQGCTANFAFDFTAIPEDPTCVDSAGEPIPHCTEHIRRNVRGLAVGDLDRNGFYDIVTTASVVSSEPLPLLPAPQSFGSVFDGVARFLPIIEGLTSDDGIWNGYNPGPGDLAVELASDNGNGWVAVTARGSVGLTPQARVNRDGIGAVLSFTPLGGPTVMSPVTAGSSHLSQHSPERLFGLGESRLGTLEILWPGGVRNRFYGVRHGERLELPEIPCSFDTEGPFVPYIACLSTALFDLLEEQRIDRRLGLRLYTSAIFAFLDRQ